MLVSVQLMMTVAVNAEPELIVSNSSRERESFTKLLKLQNRALISRSANLISDCVLSKRDCKIEKRESECC